MTLNKACLIGHVGQDPEIKNTQEGREIAKFSMATSESWTDKSTGQKKDKTEWHNIIIFNPILIKLVKNYVKKGSKLYIEGKIQTRKYKEKNELKDRYITEIVIDFESVLTLLDSKQIEPAQHYSEPKEIREPKPSSNFNPDLEDDIPF